MTQVFAVEDTSAQVIHNKPALAAEEITGLAPGDGVAGTSVRTLHPPPGRELFRFATLSDIHIGETAFGVTRRMRDRRGPGPYPERCAAAALRELTAWGAQLLVIKGDMTDRAREVQWRGIANLLQPMSIPIVATAGNHDVVTRGVNGRPFLEPAGVDLTHDVAVHDRPGVRFVLVHSAQQGISSGRLGAERRDGATAAIAGTHEGSAAVLVTHHQPHLRRWRHYHPAGIAAEDSIAMLDAVRETSRPTLWITGHTHRHRRWVHRGVAVAETGSPKDFPGTWTGYVVYEGPAIRQVVRRVADPDVLAWTQHTRRAALGAWGIWSPGRLEDRCWVEDFAPTSGN